jgi:hypothetical protein
MSSINTESKEARDRCADCKSSARGTCIECYMKDHSYDANGRLKMPSTLHSLRQAYYMEEEWYLTSRRLNKLAEKRS